MARGRPTGHVAAKHGIVGCVDTPMIMNDAIDEMMAAGPHLRDVTANLQARAATAAGS